MTEDNTTKEGLRFLAQLLGSPELLAAIDDGRQFKWAPKKGITAEEIAVCLPLAVLTLTGKKFEVWARIYDVMPSNYQRHFTVIAGDTTTHPTENPSQQP